MYDEFVARDNKSKKKNNANDTKYVPKYQTKGEVNSKFGGKIKINEENFPSLPVPAKKNFNEINVNVNYNKNSNQEKKLKNLFNEQTNSNSNSNNNNNKVEDKSKASLNHVKKENNKFVDFPLKETSKLSSLLSNDQNAINNAGVVITNKKSEAKSKLGKKANFSKINYNEEFPEL